MQKLLKYASLYKKAASSEIHRWAAKIVNQAFFQVMGRAPTPAERQIVQAVSSAETGYGRGWGKGQSTSGQGSHNWGAITAPKGFQHQDSSVQGKHQAIFKEYPDDLSGAADVVRTLFKSGHKQHEPNPEQGFRASGPEIPGPTRGQLIEEACQSGDVLAFSKAMWYTVYYEGIASSFVTRIYNHANNMMSKVNAIASANGEAPAWSMKSNNYLPETNDRSVLMRISSYEAGVVPQASSKENKISPKDNVKPQANFTQPTIPEFPGQTEADVDSLLKSLWF
jgi:hypothetical protein